MAEQIQQRLIEQEMKEAYIDYAMSVIVGRALPDVHDGLKPVHRRILFTMYNMGLLSNKPTKKCARIVGNVMGRFHPHGDLAVYDALVRMAQDFSLRYPLIVGQGNFGSVDGDTAAAQRYTEAKLSKLAEEMLIDIKKNTVNFVPNYDGSLKEPSVLPSKIPNLLINGSSGIAVGMATNMPPHNLTEVVDAIIAFIDNNEVSIEELMELIKGPDFPTAGYILGRSGIINAFKTGRGKIKIRAKSEISGKKILITEIPYQVNKSVLIEDIANLVRDKRIDGITDIRDESDRKGMQIVIETRANSNPELILNQLYKHSQLQETFGVINVALVNGQPKVLNLKELIDHYVKHRKRVVIRRTEFDLSEAEKREHLLKGLKIAIINIDPVVKMIKGADNPEIARDLLIANYKLSVEQAQAILEMRLQRLTSLEVNKIENELKELFKLIIELKGILESEIKVYDIIKKELLEIKQRYGDERRTQILDLEEDIDDESLIKEEEVVVTISHAGYIKRITVDTYQQQKRGGKGIMAMETKDEDFVEHLFVSHSHAYTLFFTDKGKVYWLKTYKLPEAGRYAKGTNLVNLLNLKKDENVTATVPLKKFKENEYLIMITKKGVLKKSSVMDYSNPRKSGIIAINLREGDRLVTVKLTNGEQKYIIGTRNGLAVKFDEKQVRSMGRGATGVRGIRLKNDEVVGMELATNEDDSLLTVTENGFGKRTPISEYRLINRGGKGVINMKASVRNGKIVSIKTVKDDHELMCITKNGVLIRLGASDMRDIGRNTQGVRIMRLKENDKVINVARIIR